MDWEVIQRARSIYFKHLGFDEEKYYFLWNQATEEYRQAFINIAKMDIEDENLNGGFNGYE